MLSAPAIILTTTHPALVAAFGDGTLTAPEATAATRPAASNRSTGTSPAAPIRLGSSNFVLIVWSACISRMPLSAVSLGLSKTQFLRPTRAFAYHDPPLLLDHRRIRVQASSTARSSRL